MSSPVSCGATLSAPKQLAELATWSPITINGKNFQVTGRNIAIRNGTVMDWGSL